MTGYLSAPDASLDPTGRGTSHSLRPYGPPPSEEGGMTGRQGCYGLRAAAFAFPFRGRWHGEAMTDEVPLPGELAQPQAMTERSWVPISRKT